MADPITLADVQELADFLGEPIDESTTEGKRAVMCLRAASALVRKESGRTWLTESGTLQTDIPDDVVMVTLYVASRVFDNRNAQTRGGVDDYQEGWKVDEAGAYLSPTERRTLSAYRPAAVGGLGVVSTTRIEPRDTSGWVPTDTPGVVFPWY